MQFALFLNLPHYLIKPHSLRIGGLTIYISRDCLLKLFKNGVDGHRMHLNDILDANTMFSTEVSNELWFIGNKFLQDVFAVMMDNKNCFHLLQEFEQVRSQFLATMLMEHVPMVLIHLLNTHRCIPDIVVIHVGESDFSWELNEQQRCNVADMTAKVKKLLNPFSTFHITVTWCKQSIILKHMYFQELARN